MRIVKAAMGILLSIGLGFALLYILLIVFDPIGIYTYQSNLASLYQYIIPHPVGYSYETGRIQLRGFEATILSDGLRFVPDTMETSDCRIVFAGDSVTFGLGVNDKDSFANLAAQDLQVEVWNSAHNGYNTVQVERAINYYSATIYVYLMVGNDREATRDFVRSDKGAPNAFGLYARWLFLTILGKPQGYPIAQDIDSFQVALNHLLNRDNVLVFAYGDGFQDLQDTRILRIAGYDTHTISISDPHPNREGHQILYQGMRPYLEDAILKYCR